MKCSQILVLWVFWVLILWLMAPCLDLTTESAPQEKQKCLVPWSSTCPWFKFRKCGCPSETLNCSSCHHTSGECNWFDICYKKTMGYLTRTKESMASDTVLWWLGMNSGSEVGKVWKKVFRVIRIPSASHFDFYCGTCAVLGSSLTLQGSSLGDKIDQHPIVFRNASNQGSWRQLLWLLQLPDLAWTQEALSDEVMESSSGILSVDFRRWPSSLVEEKTPKARYNWGN
ncbi:uncharacterized protein LOC128573518 [Nycticebus coucang]|uniref:uncharacterized protein LOC128573518 n=1 Tax=Nycticebus coucang TaxID=9470 RepID=UPI00234D3447|nr:uncharacterized protein LOC128573518 [Nycticebus coucang]